MRLLGEEIENSCELVILICYFTSRFCHNKTSKDMWKLEIQLWKQPMPDKTNRGRNLKTRRRKTRKGVVVRSSRTFRSHPLVTVLRLIPYSVNFPVLSSGNRKCEFHRVIPASAEKFSHEATRRRLRWRQSSAPSPSSTALPEKSRTKRFSRTTTPSFPSTRLRLRPFVLSLSLSLPSL